MAGAHRTSPRADRELGGGIGNGPPRGIGNGQDDRLGPFPVFLENWKSLENKENHIFVGKVACPNGSYGP